MTKKKDFFEELKDRKVFREVYANMAKETAREWEIDYLP